MSDRSAADAARAGYLANLARRDKTAADRKAAKDRKRRRADLVLTIVRGVMDGPGTRDQKLERTLRLFGCLPK